MRAVVVRPDSSPRLIFSDVPEPIPGAAEAVVRMVATSLNYGEIKRALFTADVGFRPGWDVAGIVEKPAIDGSGPGAGERVIGFTTGMAWAERVALPGRHLAVIPDNVSFATAATLPVAGLTAYYGLARAGMLAGKSILVTGASGGVGHLACQLASASSATVTAFLRSDRAIAEVEAYGVDHVVVAERLSSCSRFGPFDVILDAVGGDVLSDALSMLAPEGVCVTYGAAGETLSEFHPRPFFRAGSTRLYGLYVYEEIHRHPPAAALSRLAQLVGKGVLRPRVTIQTEWHDIEEVGRQLLDREITGKAVLLFD